jgi:flavin reductase (DIM6/NTAB) family NADH-FMN oxidoreductase RutF
VSRLAGSVAAIECAVWREYEAGDHALVVSSLTAAARFTPDTALCYVDRQYRVVAAEGQELTPQAL